MPNKLEVRGLALLAALAAASPAAAQPLRVLEGVTRENLTLFPIVAASWEGTDRFRTLDEALASGEASVREQAGGGQVSRLVLSYKGDRPLLLIAGEVVVGGQQDRVIVGDRIVAPGTAALPLDVFCVEQGRWSGGAAFSASNLIVHPSVREKAIVDKKQGDVWATVRDGTTARGVAETVEVAPAAPPPPLRAALAVTMAEEVRSESYARAYSSARVAKPVDTLAQAAARDLRGATAGVEGVVGVVVAYGGEIAWADRFASPELFRRYSEKLLRSYAVEALARPRAVERPSRDDAREYLRGLGREGRESVEAEPGVYRRRETTDDDHAELELVALGARPLAVHWVKVRRSR